jgi:DNA replication protein DnaC
MFRPAGSRIACNGQIHVTSNYLSRHLLRFVSGAFRHFRKFIVYFHTPQLDSHIWQFDSFASLPLIRLAPAILEPVPTLAIDSATDTCTLCGGSGMRIIQKDGRQFAQPCDCRVQRRATARVEQAHIPRRYEHCSLDNYDTHFPSSHRSLAAAHLRARKFVQSYPLETAGTGLLITGSIGVGKTHLAVGILQALVAERGATGLFYDYRDLLKQVQNSYNRQVSATELEILAPVFNAEVLVLDELGASKPTDWVWDTVAHILNTRYNDRRTTIITTNYANLAPLEMLTGGTNATRSMREETLGDRIGERMRSRLQEMCVVVEMQGEDFRQKVKRASFI